MYVGGFDLTVIIEGKTMKEVANFGSKTGSNGWSAKYFYHFVLKKYKEHGLPLEQDKRDERMLISP